MGDGADWGANFSGSSMAAYEDTLVGPLFVPWGEHLLSAVGVDVGDAVLDVACGPGTVALLAAARAGRTGSVVGCDLSDEMLSIARAKGEAGGAVIDYRQCSAESLSVENDAFDVAVCQQGFQFFLGGAAACYYQLQVRQGLFRLCNNLRKVHDAFFGAEPAGNE